MKNKVLYLCLFLICFISFKLGVSADEVGSGEKFKSYYDKGIVEINVSGAQLVTIYGKSVCNGNTCTVEYAGQYSNFEDVLKHSVVCANGEKNILYQPGSSGKTNFYDSNNSSEGFSGTMYWSEQYHVTCTSANSGVTLEDTPTDTKNESNTGNTGNTGNVPENSDNTGTTGTTTNNSNTENTDSTDEDDYNSSSTVENPEQGVNTYFIVLGLVAILSYTVMVFIKKFNLFKNV